MEEGEAKRKREGKEMGGGRGNGKELVGLGLIRPKFKFLVTSLKQTK